MPIEKVTVTPAVRKYFSALGKRGTGASKRRTPEQCALASKGKTQAQHRAIMAKARAALKAQREANHV